MTPKYNLDLTTQEFLNSLKIDKPLYEMTPDEARNFLWSIQNQTHTNIEASIEDVEIFDENFGNITVKLVRPENKKDEKLPLIVYCHGGGWVMGDFEIYDMTVKTIANCTESAVAFIEYPRSPEFPYPHALNHISGALKFLYQNTDKYKLNRERIALVGDSAGGNMAAVTAMNLIRNSDIKLCFLALLYPVTDAEMSTESYKEFKDGPWLSKKAMEWFFKNYAPDKEIRKKHTVSPLKASTEELIELPQTLIITAENDVLRDEGEEFARKLIDAGVDTACVRINNTFHDFIMLNALRESKAVKAGYKLLCKFLYHALHG